MGGRGCWGRGRRCWEGSQRHRGGGGDDKSGLGGLGLGGLGGGGGLKKLLMFRQPL